MKDEKPWYKKWWLYVIVVIILIIILSIPFLINEAYKKGSGYITMWGASEVLSFYGSFLTFLGTVSLGALALWQNKKAENLSQKANELNMINKIIEVEIGNLNRIEAVNKDFFSGNCLAVNSIFRDNLLDMFSQDTIENFSSILADIFFEDAKCLKKLSIEITIGALLDGRQNVIDEIHKYLHEESGFLDKTLATLKNPSKNRCVIIEHREKLRENYIKLEDMLDEYIMDYNFNIKFAMYQDLTLEEIGYFFYTKNQGGKINGLSKSTTRDKQHCW